MSIFEELIRFLADHSIRQKTMNHFGSTASNGLRNQRHSRHTKVNESDVTEYKATSTRFSSIARAVRRTGESRVRALFALVTQTLA